MIDDTAAVDIGDSHPEVRATTRLPRFKDDHVAERGLVPDQQPSAEPLRVDQPMAPTVDSGQLPRTPVRDGHTLEPGCILVRQPLSYPSLNTIEACRILTLEPRIPTTVYYMDRLSTLSIYVSY